MTATQTKPRGVVLDRPDLRIVDTREMAWEPFPGHHSGKIKVLRRNQDGSSATHLLYLEGPTVVWAGRQPQKHVHKTIREYAYFIEGLFPLLEYETAEPDEPAFPVHIKSGYFLDRLPNSWHGVNTAEPPPIHIVSFEFRDRAGNFIAEPEAEGETVHVPATPDLIDAAGRVARGLPISWPAGTGTLPGTVYNRGNATWLDTREMEWTESSDGCKIKPLARFTKGHPFEGQLEIYLLWQPATSPLRQAPYRHYAQTVREEFMVLSGEIRSREYDNVNQKDGELVILKPGFYVDRGPGSLHGSDDDAGAGVDSVILVRRSGAGTLAGEPHSGSEIIDVPFV
jgi:hypothetical protein